MDVILASMPCQPTMPRLAAYLAHPDHRPDANHGATCRCPLSDRRRVSRLPVSEARERPQVQGLVRRKPNRYSLVWELPALSAQLALPGPEAREPAADSQLRVADDLLDGRLQASSTG